MTISKQDAARELLRRRKARESLIGYVNAIDIPGKPISDDADEWIFRPVETTVADHHRVILEACQRTIDKPYGRLMIFAPPGSAKSTYGSVVVPTWCMGRETGYKIILASYGSDLARKHGRRARQIVKSDKYQSIFGCGISADNASVEQWSITNGSEYMSCGIMSGITGNRANGIIIDDPVKGREEAESETIRSRTIDAYEDDLKTRLLPGGWIILIQTRWHVNDLAGCILPENWNGQSGMIKCRDGFDWEVICLSAKCDDVNDPLCRNIGEYIWPEWFDKKHWSQFEADESSTPLKKRSWASLYQQRPTVQGGSILHADQFKLWKNDLPHFDYILQSYDTAFTEKTQNDPTACTVWGVFTHNKQKCVLLLDVWADHLEYTPLRQRVIDDWQAKYGGNKNDVQNTPRRVDAIIVEEKGSGISLIQDLRRAKVPVISYNPGKADKISRANQIAPILDVECVYVLESAKQPTLPISWARPFLKQCEQFPNGKNDDMIDTMTQALIWLRDNNMLMLPIAEDDEVEEIDYNQRRNNTNRNPYDC